MAGWSVQRLRSCQRGDALVILVVFIVALFAMGALSIDVGNAQLQRKKIHEGTDAAALAAVPEWWITKNQSVVDDVARAFAIANGVSSNEIVSVRSGKWENNAFVELISLGDDDVPAVQVIARRKVDMLFARIIGFTEMNPRVESVAIVGKAYESGCAVPWAACDNMPAISCAPLTLQISTSPQNEAVFTNACTQSSVSGNFGLLSFPGSSGASDIAKDIRGCASVPLRVGQCIQTAPGVKWGPVRGALNDVMKDESFDCAGEAPLVIDENGEQRRNLRAVVLPKITELPPDATGKETVCITGFYTVRLDNYFKEKNLHTVEATFMKRYDGQSVDSEETPIEGELNGVALVK